MYIHNSTHTYTAVVVFTVRRTTEQQKDLGVISNGEKGRSDEKEKPGGRVVNEREKERRREFLYFTILHQRT